MAKTQRIAETALTVLQLLVVVTVGTELPKDCTNYTLGSDDKETWSPEEVFEDNFGAMLHTPKYDWKEFAFGFESEGKHPSGYLKFKRNEDQTISVILGNDQGVEIDVEQLPREWQGPTIFVDWTQISLKKANSTLKLLVQGETEAIFHVHTQPFHFIYAYVPKGQFIEVTFNCQIGPSKDLSNVPPSEGPSKDLTSLNPSYETIISSELTSQPPNKHSNGGSTAAIIIVVLIILASAIGVGYWLVRKRKRLQRQNNYLKNDYINPTGKNKSGETHSDSKDGEDQLLLSIEAETSVKKDTDMEDTTISNFDDKEKGITESNIDPKEIKNEQSADPEIPNDVSDTKPKSTESLQNNKAGITQERTDPNNDSKINKVEKEILDTEMDHSSTTLDNDQTIDLESQIRPINNITINKVPTSFTRTKETDRVSYENDTSYEDKKKLKLSLKTEEETKILQNDENLSTSKEDPTLTTAKDDSEQNNESHSVNKTLQNSSEIQDVCEVMVTKATIPRAGDKETTIPSRLKEIEDDVNRANEASHSKENPQTPVQQLKIVTPTASAGASITAKQHENINPTTSEEASITVQEHTNRNQTASTVASNTAQQHTKMSHNASKEASNIAPQHTNMSATESTGESDEAHRHTASTGSINTAQQHTNMSPSASTGAIKTAQLHTNVSPAAFTGASNTAQQQTHTSPATPTGASNTAKQHTNKNPTASTRTLNTSQQRTNMSPNASKGAINKAQEHINTSPAAFTGASNTAQQHTNMNPTASTGALKTVQHTNMSPNASTGVINPPREHTKTGPVASSGTSNTTPESTGTSKIAPESTGASTTAPESTEASNTAQQHTNMNPTASTGALNTVQQHTRMSPNASTGTRNKAQEYTNTSASAATGASNTTHQYTNIDPTASTGASNAIPNSNQTIQSLDESKMIQSFSQIDPKRLGHSFGTYGENVGHENDKLVKKGKGPRKHNPYPTRLQTINK